MLDQITNPDFEVVETQPDPQDLYRSQVKSDTPKHMAKFVGKGGVIDLDVAIEKMISLATGDVPAAKKRCADPDARAFIFQYVHHFMADDVFVARMRVIMLQHVVEYFGSDIPGQNLLHRALDRTVPDLHTQEVRKVCNTADHHAMRLQLIRAFTNEAILRVMSDYLVIKGD
jgi:hypothetical protein